MNDHSTRGALLAAARDLFARLGYEGTSVRAITKRAKANLGAVTYHFGSKLALYQAVIASVADPLRTRAVAALEAPGAPLDRIEAALRAYFTHLAANPEMIRLILQRLVAGKGPPPPARDALRQVARALVATIEEGQRGGSIRDGDPLLLAVSALAQPVFFHLMRDALRDVTGLNTADPDARARVLEHLVAFARRGLAVSHGGATP